MGPPISETHQHILSTPFPPPQNKPYESTLFTVLNSAINFFTLLTNIQCLALMPHQNG